MHEQVVGCLLLHFSDKRKHLQNACIPRNSPWSKIRLCGLLVRESGLLVRESGLLVLIAFVNMLFFMSMKVFNSPESWGVGNIDDVLSVQLLY